MAHLARLVVFPYRRAIDWQSDRCSQADWEGRTAKTEVSAILQNKINGWNLSEVGNEADKFSWAVLWMLRDAIRHHKWTTKKTECYDEVLYEIKQVEVDWDITVRLNLSGPGCILTDDLVLKSLVFADCLSVSFTFVFFAAEVLDSLIIE